jgi:hypothetical protein
MKKTSIPQEKNQWYSNLFTDISQKNVQTPVRFLETDVLMNEGKLKKIADKGHWDLVPSLEFVAEQEQRGKIICIVGAKTDLCKHTNSHLTKKRGKREPQNWTGYNYRRSWCTDINRPGVVSSEYEKLIALLLKDKYVRNFEYRLVRPDGAFVEYLSDFLYLEDLLGEPVRIGFSWPEDYRELSPADPDRAIV